MDQETTVSEKIVFYSQFPTVGGISGHARSHKVTWVSTRVRKKEEREESKHGHELSLGFPCAGIGRESKLGTG